MIEFRKEMTAIWIIKNVMSDRSQYSMYWQAGKHWISRAVNLIL